MHVNNKNQIIRGDDLLTEAAVNACNQGPIVNKQWPAKGPRQHKLVNESHSSR